MSPQHTSPSEDRNNHGIARVAAITTLALVAGAFAVRSLFDTRDESAAAAAIIGKEQSEFEARRQEFLLERVESGETRVPAPQLEAFIDSELRANSLVNGESSESDHADITPPNSTSSESPGGSLSNLGIAFLQISHPVTPGSIAPELMEAVRKELQFEISDEALERGLVKMSDVVNGLALDLGLSPNDPRYAGIVAESLVAYKRTEAMLEAQKIYGISTVAELDAMSPAQWATIGTLVDQRTATDKMQLGSAIMPAFGPYLTQLLLFQQAQQPGWLQAPK